MNLIILVIFVLAVIVVGFWLVKIEHHFSKAKIVIIVILLLALYLSISSVLSSAHVDLKSPKGIINGVYVYVGWVGKTISGLWDVGADTTGRVIEAVQVDNSSKQDR